MEGLVSLLHQHVGYVAALLQALFVPVLLRRV